MAPRDRWLGKGDGSRSESAVSARGRSGGLGAQDRDFSWHRRVWWRIVGGVSGYQAASSPPADGPLTDFDVLFGAEWQPMVRLAVLLVDSRAVAEEIVQDGFAAVAARWGELERPGAYLRTSVVNGCRMTLRRRETQRRLEPPRSTVPLDSPTELVELHSALMTLPERQRVVLVLRYFHDRPDAEIAELVGCRPATVRSLAARGLRHLRKELT
jgi:RNA polymerase sigma factor (sigma-70 family)